MKSNLNSVDHLDKDRHSIILLEGLKTTVRTLLTFLPSLKKLVKLVLKKIKLPLTLMIGNGLCSNYKIDARWQLMKKRVLPQSSKCSGQ